MTKKFLHVGSGRLKKDKTTEVFNTDEWSETRLDIDEDVKSDYDEIIEEIKKNCTYYDIIEYENSEGEVNDYVCYSCSQSKYKGKIGFTLKGRLGYIRHFPNE